VAGSAPSDLSEFVAVAQWDGEPEIVHANGHSNGHSDPAGSVRGEPRANGKAPCPQCGRLVSDTANGWNAHRRFCPGSTTSTNGNGAH
jgi:hypothetical protein